MDRMSLASLVFLLPIACDDDDEPAVGAVDAASPSDGAPPALADAPRPSPDAGAPPPAIDTDIAIVRLNADGTVDTTFGTNGIARVDFGPGSGTVRDALWGIARDAQNRIVLFGAGKGDGARTDLDRVVARVTAGGALDTTFGTMGFHRLNIANLGDNPRHGLVQADGKIVSSGYTAQPTGVGTQTANKVVLLRLDEAGKPDPAFGFMGVVNSAPLIPAEPTKTEWGVAEAYSVGLQSGKYVTAGYGRSAPTGTVDVLSFRYTATGELDQTWGNKGVVTLDLVGDNDRGRHLAVLPDGRVLIAGSGTPQAMNVDAMAILLQPNGALDPSFDMDGHKLWDFGRPDEAFYGVSVSANGGTAVLAGYRAGAAGGMVEDDDATIAFLPLAGGAEVAKAVPLSETENDRFWSVAFGADGKAYAAGYLADGPDTQMVVARYDTTGALDRTFGTGGVAKVNVVGAGALETARDVVVLPDGKVVIAGEVEKR